MNDTELEKQIFSILHDCIVLGVDEGQAYLKFTDEAVDALAALVARREAAIYKKAIELVAKQRPIFLTTDDTNPFGDDPMAEKAVAIRDQLRKEIIADLEAALTTEATQGNTGDSNTHSETTPTQKSSHNFNAGERDENTSKI